MMRRIGIDQDDVLWCAALSIPLAVRCAYEGGDLALKRLSVLGLVFVSAFVWSALISRKLWPAAIGKQLQFSLLFGLLLFEVVGWTSTLFAVSFGWVFAREMFGGKPVLSPALVAMAGAIFSFPDTGFQETWITNSEPGINLALACLPSGLWLAWHKKIALPVLIGVTIGVAGAVILFPPSALWWEHLFVGTLVIGVVFVAADKCYAPGGTSAQIVYGGLIGLLIIAARLTSPDQPDGVVFALLLGSLFAPLLGKIFAWRLNRG